LERVGICIHGMNIECVFFFVLLPVVIHGFTCPRSSPVLIVFTAHRKPVYTNNMAAREEFGIAYNVVSCYTAYVVIVAAPQNEKKRRERE
jgi:hypothetical protein